MSAPTLQPSRRAIAATSFDFLNGSYKRAATARLVALMIVAAVLAIALLILAHGATNQIANGVDQNQLATAEATRDQTSRQLASVSKSGGLQEGQMESHLRSRVAEATSVAKGSIPAAQTLTDVQAVAANAGAQVTGVTLGTAAAAPSTPSTTADPGPAAASTGAVPVTITATVSSYGEIQPWMTAVGQIAYLRGVSTKWASGGTDPATGATSITVTTTATLSPTAPSAQLGAVNTLLGVKPTTTTSAGAN